MFNLFQVECFQLFVLLRLCCLNVLDRRTAHGQRHEDKRRGRGCREWKWQKEYKQTRQTKS